MLVRLLPILLVTSGCIVSRPEPPRAEFPFPVNKPLCERFTVEQRYTMNGGTVPRTIHTDLLGLSDIGTESVGVPLGAGSADRHRRVFGQVVQAAGIVSRRAPAARGKALRLEVRENLAFNPVWGAAAAFSLGWIPLLVDVELTLTAQVVNAAGQPLRAAMERRSFQLVIHPLLTLAGLFQDGPNLKRFLRQLTKAVLARLGAD